MIRALLGALLGGVAIFIGGYITHNVLPISNAGIQPIPNEFVAIGMLQSTIPASGVYVYPGMEGVNQKDQAAMAAYQARTRELPHGMVVMSTTPGDVTPAKLGFQFLGDLLAASVAAVLLVIAPMASYIRRLFFVTMLGLFAGFLIDFPLWNWYGFTGVYAVSDILDHMLRSLAGGLALAALVKPAK